MVIEKRQAKTVSPPKNTNFLLLRRHYYGEERRDKQPISICGPVNRTTTLSSA